MKLHRLSSFPMLLRVSSRSMIGVIAAVLVATSTSAGPADVLLAKAQCSADSVCSFDVTVRHADEGWNHYADRYEIVGPEGEVLARRVLQHPHVDEQPFKRSIAGVRVPSSIREVTIRAHDSVHGLGGAEVKVLLGR
jgi:hypothetical protein